jgi:hypothetical protein
VAGVWTTIDAGDGSVMYMAIGPGSTTNFIAFDTVIGGVAQGLDGGRGRS